MVNSNESGSEEIDECFGDDGGCHCKRNHGTREGNASELGPREKELEEPKSSVQATSSTTHDVINIIPHNTYSPSASVLLSSLVGTPGADILLEEHRNPMKMKTRKIQVTEDGKQGLVSLESIPIRQLIIQVHGFISLPEEVKRDSGVFRYEGLPDQNVICIDTRIHGNDSKVIRRSCQPNCILKHVLGAHARLGVFVVSMKEIRENREITLGFDSDSEDSEVTLECADHEECPMERQRKEKKGI